MMTNPSLSELEKGYSEFQKHEKRDAMYKTASFLVKYFWGKPQEMADSLGVLLLTWNQAFYRYGLFDFDKLEQCIHNNQNTLAIYREKVLINYNPSDDSIIIKLFNDFLSALQIASGKKSGVKSPVSVSKALHLLAPGYFPLWDDKIARAYNCYYSSTPEMKYIQFMIKIKAIADDHHLDVNSREDGKTIIKLIDEYNYSKYTKHWI